VPEELGDDDEVGAPAHEPCREGVAQDVGGDLVVLQAGGGDDRGDDVVRALDRQAAAALVENRAGVSAPGQSARSSSQPVRALRRSAWIGISRTFSPLPRIRRMPLRADRRTSLTSRPVISAIRAPA
jgi:hypothetical protein